MFKPFQISSLLMRNSKSLVNSSKLSFSTIGDTTESSSIDSSAGKKLRFCLPSKKIPAAHYAGRHTVSMLYGDGVGPELLQHLKLAFKHLNCKIYFEDLPINKNSSDEEIEEAILSLQRNGVGIKGNLITADNSVSKNLLIRKSLDMNVYLQRCFSFPGVETRHNKVDIAIIRENSEGEYSRLEHENIPGVVESLKIMTRNKCEKIARFAFDYALENNRRKVTCVHKANIMKLGDGLFLKTCTEIAKEYPTIDFDSIIIDNCCMQLVTRPEKFDVMVMPNLYGNIVGNVAAGLIGGPGITAGVNLSSFNDIALFEMGTRNSGSSIMGKNIANPTCILLAGANMLEYLGHEDHGRLLRLAVFDTTKRQRLRTPDIGGNATTTQFVDGVLKYINENGK